MRWSQTCVEFHESSSAKAAVRGGSLGLTCCFGRFPRRLLFPAILSAYSATFVFPSFATKQLALKHRFHHHNLWLHQRARWLTLQLLALFPTARNSAGPFSLQLVFFFRNYRMRFPEFPFPSCIVPIMLLSLTLSMLACSISLFLWWHGSHPGCDDLST